MLRERVLATYSWDEAALATERVYAELLARRGRAPRRAAPEDVPLAEAAS